MISAFISRVSLGVPMGLEFGASGVAAGHSVGHKNNSTNPGISGHFTICAFPLSQRGWQ